jgi:hypothetical protein
MKHGKGTYTYLDGDKYSGEFKNGKHHGSGKITYANGKIFRGMWENNYLNSRKQ